MSLDHAAISPDGDGVEDDSPAHVKATGAWKVEVLGPGLSSPKVIATGSGDANFTWDGLVEGQPLPNGSYTLRLTELGSGQTRTVPTVISTPFSLAAQYEAFSPNATPDGVKDTDRLEIKATGAWSLQVEGHPGALGGVPENQSGNASFNWNGKVNGITLLDGKYTLRLKAGAEEKTVEVTLDTSPPTINDAYLDGFDEDLNGEVFYTFAVDAVDANGPTGSGINPAEVKILFENATCSPDGASTLDADAKFRAKYKVVSISRDAKKLKFSARVYDLAGNSSQVTSRNGSLADSFSSTALSGESIADSFEFAYADTSTSSAYSLLGGRSPRFTVKENSVYYNRSKIFASLLVNYKLIYKTKTGSIPLHGRKLFYIQDSHNPLAAKTYFIALVSFGPTIPSIEILWDGKDHQNQIGSFAPKGVYYVSDEPSNEVRTSAWLEDPLIRTGKKKYSIKLPFRVSDHPVLTLDKWYPTVSPSQLLLAPQTVPISQPDFIYNRVAHVLQRHVYTSPYNGKLYRYTNHKAVVTRSGNVVKPEYFSAKAGAQSTGDPAKDVFGAYSPLLRATAPLTPYGTAFDEGQELIWTPGPYPVTQTEFYGNAQTRNILNTLNGIANAIRFQPQTDITATGDRGDGRAMPVVLPDLKLMWIGYLPLAAPQPLGNPNAFNSIFPAWKTQEAYEATIK